MLFNSYSYEILHEQSHRICLQGDTKLLLATVNNRPIFRIEIVHDLLRHPIISSTACFHFDNDPSLLEYLDEQSDVTKYCKRITDNTNMTTMEPLARKK